MKKNLTLFFLFLVMSITVIAGTIKTKYTYSKNINDYTFYLSTFFYFGAGTSCPEIDFFKGAQSNDTLYIKAFYDIRGHWAAKGCESLDSIKYTNPYSGINYISISTNAITNLTDESVVDTLWNLDDTTMALSATGIPEPEISGRSFNVYPNPAANAIRIDGREKNNCRMLRIFNATGQMVLEQSGQLDREIDIRNLAPGLYFIRFFDKGNNSIGAARFHKQQ
jgi:hypothetical protein